MGSDTFFLIGLCLLLVHEMDAIRLREWRMFVLLNSLSDERAYLYFTALHIPLYIGLFVGLFGTDGPNRTVVTVLSIFFVVHVALHLLFLRHPDNGFRSAFSWFLIVSCGVCGALQLLRSST